MYFPTADMHTLVRHVSYHRAYMHRGLPSLAHLLEMQARDVNMRFWVPDMPPNLPYTEDPFECDSRVLGMTDLEAYKHWTRNYPDSLLLLS